MRYLLDTNACIAYLNNPQSSVRYHLEKLKPSDVAVCSVVTAELFYGAMKSAAVARNLARLEEFLAPLVSLPFTDDSARIFGSIRATLASNGTPIGPYDLQIASIALEHGLVLVTRNTREFIRVPNLQVEDWERSQS